MTKAAWAAYRKYAWGADEFDPVRNSSFAERGELVHSGRTIVSAASTLYVLGLMEEFEQAREWIRTKLNLSQVDAYMSVCDVVTDLIGGLLSCYALTGDQMFLRKALSISNIFEGAYNFATGKFLLWILLAFTNLYIYLRSRIQ